MSTVLSYPAQAGLLRASLNAALALAAGIGACLPAQAAEPQPERSRAEVIAELLRARADGLMPAENEVDPFTTQRRAEALARQALAAAKPAQAPASAAVLAGSKAASNAR